MANQLSLSPGPLLKYFAHWQAALLLWQEEIVACLGVASPRTQRLFANWIVAWRGASWQVEDASSEAGAEAHAGEAWKSIDPPS